MNCPLKVTAFLGNALILVALHKGSSIYPPTKLLFRCLAVTDLCIGLVSQPLYAMYVMSTVTTKINRNIFRIFFIVQHVSTFVLCGVSILISTAISVDRLLAVLLGLRYRHVVTLRRVRAAIICFWLLSLALGGWMLFTIVDFSEALIVFIVVMTLCLLTSLFSYTKIYLRLRHHQSQAQPQVHQAQPPNAGQIPLNIARYKKTVSIIAWVQLALLFCYLPFSVYHMLVLFGEISHEIASLFVVSFLYLNSSLNPILYCWKIPEVRQVVKDTNRQLNCCAAT